MCLFSLLRALCTNKDTFRSTNQPSVTAATESKNTEERTGSSAAEVLQEQGEGTNDQISQRRRNSRSPDRELFNNKGSNLRVCTLNHDYDIKHKYHSGRLFDEVNSSVNEGIYHHGVYLSHNETKLIQRSINSLKLNERETFRLKPEPEHSVTCT